MAITTYGTRTAATSLSARIDAVRAEFAKWRLYRRTLAELQSLNGRELADLGLHRSMIKRIALDAAYGG
jgi:uncharacterized protein YjiS (DUF1127 family)